MFGLASLAAGTSARATVWLLDMVSAAAFILTGLLLDRLTRRYTAPGDVRAARLRAALLWTGSAGALGALGAVLAWLTAWPYVLPWYDALGWALLPLSARSSGSAETGQVSPTSPLVSASPAVPANPVVLAERVMVVRTAVLGMAYLPARSAGIVIPAGLRWVEPVLRSAVCPAMLAALGIYMVVSLVRGGRSPEVNRT